MNKKFYKTVFIFTPLFISANGIYQREITEEGLQPGEVSFVFPIISIIAVFYFLLIVIKFFKGRKIHVNKYYTIILSLIFIYTLTASLIGYAVYNEFVIILRWFQFITFLLGIVIFYWLIYMKKINIRIFLN